MEKVLVDQTAKGSGREWWRKDGGFMATAAANLDAIGDWSRQVLVILDVDHGAMESPSLPPAIGVALPIAMPEG